MSTECYGWPEEGDFLKKLHRVVCVIKDKRSFESFMCLDPVGRRWCVQHERARTPDAVVASLR